MTQAAAAITVRTTCPYCGVGCGILATPQADGSVAIAGDPGHPANFGRLCSKGTALGETLSLTDRLLRPRIEGREAHWDEALDLVAGRFREAIQAFGPDSVAIYGSGQLLTEDYYVANKLMKGFVGSANIDTNSRLCMASSVAGHKRAFGSDTVPGNYEDLEAADLVVLVGSNLAWCHPVLHQRLLAAKARRPQMRIMLIDPRRTVSAELTDLHLPIQPDGDIALFVGLLRHLAAAGAATDFASKYVVGTDGAVAAAAAWDIARVTEATGLAPTDLETFYRWFAETERVVTVYSQGVNQSATGTDKVNAIINCHLLTGRIGRPGMGPFSVTGQPNAMGGREVGGLANMLAAHMDFSPETIERVGRFWKAERMAETPGLGAVDLFAAMAAGRIKAVWIMGTNPVVSMPDADAVRDALKACPFVVVSDMTERTDSAQLAHVLLPAAPWGEKDGTVTNSERRISRQRAFLAPAGQAKPDWWIITQVARRMGFGAAFPYETPAEIFAEHARLSGFENEGRRDFDISGLLGENYDLLEPVQWPVREKSVERLFADGGFYTPDGKARMLPIEPPPVLNPAPGRMVLNTGRVRDHWHTMTRTGKTARLSAHYAEPFVEIHPEDARRLNIRKASLVRLARGDSETVVRALLSERQRKGSVFAPMHWTGQFASKGRIDALVAAKVDPVSAQPALKMSEVTVEPWRTSLYGFFVALERPRLDTDYWAWAPAPRGTRGELAWRAEPADWSAWIGERFHLDAKTKMSSVGDPRSGRRSFAGIRHGQLVFALFVSPDPVPVAREWIVGQLSVEKVDGLKILAGRPGADMPDSGPIVCACHAVGRNVIREAIRRGCPDVDAVGAATKAGTNCGACRTEIASLIRSEAILT
ncbi:molybdopterin-dependent oxidoreductase [Devosia albogilva]|uniref:Molybdopterin-dependent oxidoreductase n=1 Tax=Devosia albogilva TaxID=429726 RepID=A0ABW5QNW7_9HYPH